MTGGRAYLNSAVLLWILTGVYTLLRIQAGISLAAYALPVVLWFLLPRITAPGEQRFRSAVTGYSVCGAAVYLAVFFMIGFLLKEIAASPYSLSAVGILTNLGNAIPLMILREWCRDYSLGVIRFRCRRQMAAISMLVIFMTVSSISLSRWGSITGTEELFIYVAVNILPAVTQQILLTVLVYYGGATAGICYQGIIEVFLYIFPVLPSLPWIAQSSLGIAYPVFLAVFTREMYGMLQKKVKKIKKRDSAFYVGVMLAVAFCWFCVGVFPTYPSVVLTGSMEPNIDPGDVILIDKITAEKEIYRLTAGDVINFDREDITITHRVIEVMYDEAGNVSFLTKGDNNHSPDIEPVNPNDINGVVEHVVPKAGIPLLLLNSGEEMPEGVTDEKTTYIQE